MWESEKRAAVASKCLALPWQTVTNRDRKKKDTYLDSLSSPKSECNAIRAFCEKDLPKLEVGAVGAVDADSSVFLIFERFSSPSAFGLIVWLRNTNFRMKLYISLYRAGSCGAVVGSKLQIEHNYFFRTFFWKALHFLKCTFLQNERTFPQNARKFTLTSAN